jgi:hypothetical protein
MVCLRGISTASALALIFLIFWTLATPVAEGQGTAESAQQLIKDVVYNELTDHRHHGYFEYLDRKQSGQQVQLKAEVETSTGRIHRLLAEDGQPLSAERQREEARRLDALLHDRSQQQKLLHDYQGDEDRIARIVGLLPEGFVYRFDGVDGDDIRLKYQPNPEFKPPTYEARVFHGMAGTLWVNAREKRLSRLRGKLVANVDFGYGLLGRLDQGGTFDLERTEVAPGCWKTRVLDVHITGHVILLKSIGKEQTEVRSEFRRMPPDLSLEAAAAVLAEASANGEARKAQLEMSDRSPRALPAAMALK